MNCYNCKFFTFHPKLGCEFCVVTMKPVEDPWQYCEQFDEIEKL